MDRSKCNECGGTLRMRAHQHEERVGKFKVRDASGTVAVCEKCGKTEMPLTQLQGYEQRAARTVLLDRVDADGAVMKYARRAMGLRQDQLAALLGVAGETISRWENDREAVQRPTQLALAALLASTLDLGIDLQAVASASMRGRAAKGRVLEARTKAVA